VNKNNQLDLSAYSLLIIDDNPTNLRVAIDYLEGHGFEVMMARDGEMGVERAKYTQPDLILLDVMMPQIDGFESCRRLKADEATAAIPVIFMTALTSTRDKVKAFQVGAVDYVTKPIQQEEVLARITTHLKIRDLTKRLERQNIRSQQVSDELAKANVKLSERARYLSERNIVISQTVEASSDAVTISNLDGITTYVNPAFTNLFRYTLEELKLIGGPKALFIDSGQAKQMMEAIQNGQSWSAETDLRTKACHSKGKDGRQVTTIFRTNAIFDDSSQVVGWVYLMTDISQRKRAEEALASANQELIKARDELERRVAERTAELVLANQQLALKIYQQQQAEAQLTASLEEKEVLLKEIHHRVKNNLQIISSLLYLQSDNIKDKATQEMFKDSQNRVKSMALIHEQLYQTDNLARIDLAEYIERLSNHLSRSWRANHISLQLKIDPLFLTIETAIPCGLIINELLTNAMKYAFPGGEGGQIWVQMQAGEDNQLTLSVKDNGVGFPKEINFRRPRSLGLTLVTTLVKQLKGTIELRSEANGTLPSEGNDARTEKANGTLPSEGNDARTEKANDARTEKDGTEFKIRFSDSSMKREGQTNLDQKRSTI
jgi:PAS domain S-box-containing protein